MTVTREQRLCAGCSAQFMTRHGQQQYCGPSCRTVVKVEKERTARRRTAALRCSSRTCFSCKGPTGWVRVAGTRGRPPKYCSGCRAETLRQKAREKQRKRDRAKSGNHMRRARKRGLPRENLKPLAVFEAARWRCHLCGQKVAADLRGTKDPQAPELDHIVPLSQGGGHTWDNVALACRACNKSKGARVLGQLLLFGVRASRDIGVGGV